MRPKYFLTGFLSLSLLWIGSALHAQTVPQEQTTVPRPDNYIDLRAKYAGRLENERAEREARTRRDDGLYEDFYEMEFERWERYWRDHLDAGSKEPGKMADMSRHLSRYRNARAGIVKGGPSLQSTSPACPSTGLGNWLSLGPSTYAAPIMGRVTSVYFDPATPAKAYAGAAQGGLFTTANNGGFWTNLTDASRYPALGITSIAVHPNIPTMIYIATRNGIPGGGDYGFGVLKSIDGGTTWQEIFTLATYNNQTNYNVGDGSYVSKIMLHPQDPNCIYALASHYVFRSTDAGATWQKVLEITPPSPNPNGCGYRIVDIDIINGSSGVSDSKVMVSTIRSAWMGLANSPCGTAKSFISTSGGAIGTFTEITSAVVGTDPTDRIAAAVQPGNSAEFFVAYQYKTDDFGNGPLVVKRYNIAGITASPVGTVAANGAFQLGAGYWCLEFDFSKINPNTFYLAGTTAYRVSLASGFSSAQISSYWATNPNTCVPQAQTHADIRSMMVASSGTNDVVVLGSDGGIHKAVLNPSTAYTPATANWDDLTGPGLAINEFYDVSGIQSSPDTLFAGTQDNGTFEYYNGIWEQSFNFDGFNGTTNEETGEYFGLSNAGAIKGMAGTPGTFTNISAPAIGSGPVVSDPNNFATIYGGGAHLYKSINFGLSWTTLSSVPGTTKIRAIHVAPSNSNVIYVSRDGPTWDPSNLATRLFKSSDAGLTWADIGVNLSPLAWATVSDIAVDPDNVNRVWVTFNGYWPTSNTSTSGANRVYHSSDGGGTWSDFTYNMLAFPVARIIYQRGSDDALYAGTDVGVFRYNKSLQSWECFNNQLPVVPVTGLVINYCKNKIRCSTYGRGIYESDLPPLLGKIVSASETWSGARYLSNDLIIASGATLTLTGTLNMSKARRIIVQRGATLNVNGGTITNACGDMWHGIEVWGTASAAQNLAAAQGKLIVQNNAKIENAVEAITTGRDVNGSFDWSYTGGVVQASNSFFYNNRRSASFMYYHWMNGPTEMNNLSYFRNCVFETNRLLNEPTRMPDAHISLYEVKNVLIYGCKFNNTTLTSVFGVNNRGDGIASYDAEYAVDDLTNTTTIPPIVTATSAFNGLTYGVRADFTAGVNKKAIVKNSDFNNVQRGVQVNNSIASIVSGNNFNALPNALTTSFANATWGVRMNNASGLLVLSNSVTGVAAAYQNNYGVIIDNCGSSATNMVRSNTLKDLYTGIQAQGNNGSGANGVQFRCNVFKPAMSYQLAVCPQASGTLANQGGTCALGSTADNTFFAQASPPGSQIYSPNATFTYSASGTIPTSTIGPVTVINCSSVSGECSSGGGSSSTAMSYRVPKAQDKQVANRSEGYFAEVRLLHRLRF